MDCTLHVLYSSYKYAGFPARSITPSKGICSRQHQILNVRHLRPVIGYPVFHPPGYSILCTSRSKLYKTLEEFGAPLGNVSQDDLLNPGLFSKLELLRDALT